MTEKRYQTFEEFYPFYLSQHSNINNRRLHILGTSLMLILVFMSIMNWTTKYIIYMPIISYGLAWIGHFFVEHNRPATFKYPLFSLKGDFRMIYESFTGKIKM
jgi:hypothetical protein